MKSNAKTVAQYLAALPKDRRVQLGAVRQVILDDLPLELIGKVIADYDVDSFVQLTKDVLKARK